MVTKKDTHIYYSYSIFNGVKICSPHVSKNQQGGAGGDDYEERGKLRITEPLEWGANVT
jgi:hypothetical protein